MQFAAQLRRAAERACYPPNIASRMFISLARWHSRAPCRAQRTKTPVLARFFKHFWLGKRMDAGGPENIV
jgi:hypothetical protein